MSAPTRTPFDRIARLEWEVGQLRRLVFGQVGALIVIALAVLAQAIK